MRIEKIKWDFQDVSYGSDIRQRFDMACNGNDVHAIVYIHGGGYFTGNKMQYPSFLEDYTGSCLVATIDYRIITIENKITLKDIISDVNDAVSKIIELSNTNGINIKDLILVGHSAGGHIGLLYGYNYLQKSEKIKIAACISLAGPTDFTDDIGWSSMGMWGEDFKTRLAFFSWLGSRLTNHSIQLTQHNWTKQKNYPEIKKYIESISPIMYVIKTKKIPPTLLVHGRSDNQVPYSNSVRLKLALDITSIHHKLITPVGNGNNHNLGGIAFSTDEPTLYKEQTWVEELKEWIKDYLQ